MEGWLADDKLLDLVGECVFGRDLLTLRLVCKKLAFFFSPARLLQRRHLTVPNRENPIGWLERTQLLVLGRLWTLEELKARVPFWRLAQAVERTVQGCVRTISLTGSLAAGAITGCVQASVKGAVRHVTAQVVSGVCEVPQCECVTGSGVYGGGDDLVLTVRCRKASWCTHAVALFVSLHLLLRGQHPMVPVCVQHVVLSSFHLFHRNTG